MKYILAAALVSALALPAAARERPTLWSLLDPNLIAQHILQAGVMAARSAVNVTYGHMSVDLALGRVTIGEIRVWPLSDPANEQNCAVSVDRVTLRASSIDRPEKSRLTAELAGIAVHPGCVQPELRIMMLAFGNGGVTIPHASVDINYDIPSAAADLRVHVGVENLATIDMAAEFAYFSLGATDFDFRDSAVFLDGARLTLEDAGLYNFARAWLPRHAVDPDTAGEFAADIVDEFLTDLDSEFVEDYSAPPSRARRAFVSSAATAWTDFVATPRILALESGGAPGKFIDFREIGNDPRSLFDILEPRMTSINTAARIALPVEILRDALGDDPDGLSREARLAVGRAFVTGVGAPRNIQAGVSLLKGPASKGDGEAALIIAGALALEQPREAYLHALRAGAAGADGAAAAIDRIEARLPFADVLNLQSKLTPLAAEPVAAFQSLPDIREHALDRLSGDGMARSYAMAIMWASVGAALGDAVSSSITERIEERARLSADEPGLELWVDLRERAAGLATSAWIDGNLPAIHSGLK